MRRLFFFLTFFLLMPTAWADSVAMQLDYEAPEGCSTAERFADSVSAKLGFVPWQDGATARLRVRIGEDGGEMVGTLELPDGNSKVVRNADCAQLMPALVAAVAVALDSDGVAKTPNVSPEVDEEMQTSGRIHIRSSEPSVTVSVITSRALIAGSNGAVATGVSWKEVCTAPCSFEAEYGITEVMMSGNGPSAARKVDLGPDKDAYLLARPGSSIMQNSGRLIGLLGMVAVSASLVGFLEAREDKRVRNDATGEFETVDVPPSSWVWPSFLGGAAGMGLGAGMIVWGKSELDSEAKPTSVSRVSRAITYSGTF